MGTPARRQIIYSQALARSRNRARGSSGSGFEDAAASTGHLESRDEAGGRQEAISRLSEQALSGSFTLLEEVQGPQPSGSGIASGVGLQSGEQSPLGASLSPAYFRYVYAAECTEPGYKSRILVYSPSTGTYYELQRFRGERDALRIMVASFSGNCQTEELPTAVH